jgi:hypothetical protein
MGRKIIILVLGLAIGFFLSPSKVKNTHTEKIKIEIDTVWNTITERIYIDRPVTKYERDTLIVFDSILVHVPIKSFKQLFQIQHGVATVSGEVAGELLKMDLETFLNIPTVTETVTITKTEKARGFYAGAGYDWERKKPLLGASYLVGRFNLNLNTNSASVLYRVR